MTVISNGLASSCDATILRNIGPLYLVALASVVYKISMKFALTESKRVEATPGAVGFCPGCGAELVARCGSKKIWHWAHKGKRHCDDWWEPETDWHRSWKSYFPTDWQEICSRDKAGELHIADVKVPKGLVVEVQHSAIKLEEARKRTLFHAPMIWVVDALRRKTDKTQFEKALGSEFRRRPEKRLLSRVSPYDVRLIEEWCDLQVIVAFDFGGEDVWLMSGRDWACGIGFWYKKEKLVENIREGTDIPFEQRNRRGKVIKRTHTIPNSLPKQDRRPL